jgi:hypothetical protein
VQVIGPQEVTARPELSPSSPDAAVGRVRDCFSSKIGAWQQGQIVSPTATGEMKRWRTIRNGHRREQRLLWHGCSARRDVRVSRGCYHLVAAVVLDSYSSRPILQFSAGSPLPLPGPASTCRKQRLAVECVIGQCIHVPLSAGSLSTCAMWMQAR